MYCLKFTIIPTAAMTFRILPGSILNIATYPFVPPSTFSGFLRRIVMMSQGLELPETRVNNDNPPVYALPPWCISLGAYPVLGTEFYSGIHRTYRKGMREFTHDSFSRIYLDEDKANFQLHTWEYFVAEKLIGYIVSDSLDGLAHFQNLAGYGCKLGKEGFAIIEEVSEPIKLEHIKKIAHPSTIVPMEDLLQSNDFVGGCDVYNLYRYQWTFDSDEILAGTELGLLDNTPTTVDGFTPFVTAYFGNPHSHQPELNYYTNAEIDIPIALVNLLRGEVNA
jgi:hypothetical protein